MTGNQTSHITVTYRDTDINADYTGIYAVSAEMSRELDQLREKPTGKDLQAWLDQKGCKRDCADGPADVLDFGGGTVWQRYFRDGKLHREDGPASIFRHPDGPTEEAYFRDGKLCGKDGVPVQRPGPVSKADTLFRDFHL